LFLNIVGIPNCDVRLSGLVVRVPDYRDPEVPGSIRGATKFSEIVGMERCPLNLVRIIEELLERKGSGSGLRN
jgi:hypothetical protein